MAIVVEDGTGLENSNSYISVNDATVYFSVRGITSWSELTQDKQEIALIKATDYLDNAFDWNGKKKTQEQALKFPRENLVDSDGYKVEGIPLNLKYAECECAILIATGTELFQVLETNGAVTSEKIGELAFTYDVSQKIKDSSVYESINTRLRGLYKDSTKNTIKNGKVTR